MEQTELREKLEAILKKHCLAHENKYVSFPSLIENEWSVEANSIALDAMEDALSLNRSVPTKVTDGEKSVLKLHLDMIVKEQDTRIQELEGKLKEAIEFNLHQTKLNTEIRLENVELQERINNLIN